MMGKTLKKWVALFLALALPLTFVGVAEEAWADALDVEAAASAADEAVAEAGSIALAAEDEEGAEEAEPTVGETPVEGLDEETPDSPEDGGSEAPVEAPALAQQSLTLGLGETFQLTLESGEAPEDVGAKFTSSKPRVARVDKKTGKITAKGRGNATITMQLPDGGSSVCKVKVLRAPSKVRLSASSLTLGVGEERVLTARLSSRSASALRWSSSDKSVVTVDREGRVVAVRKGTARIAVKTYNGRKATCKVTVKAAPKSIAFDETVISMWRGDSRKVKLVLSAKSAGAYTLVSDNEEAVVVKGATIQAVGLGSANIIATTYNGLTAVMSVEVCHKPVYRALLVGESSFPGTQFSSLPSKKDVSMMSRMLSSTKGATGTKWQVSTRTNRTALQIQQDILDTFAGAEEGDVSLFYISTHGDEEISIDGNWPEYAGYLVTYPNSAYTNWFDRNTLTLACLAAWLKEVPGQVVVIIDSCGSGAAVYSSKGSSAASYSPESFDTAVVDAFRRLDMGSRVANQAEGAFVVENKFFVLTSSAYQEACWTKDGKYSYFTKWLTDGIGTGGRMPADANKNRLTTLNELYKYIRRRCEKTTIRVKGGDKYQQHVQVYPSGSGFELFYRK